MDPWTIDEADFPAERSAADRLLFLLNYAVLAPSSHNAQPWLFRMRGATLELHADRTRALPVVDPEDRELTIGCGAALFHLRLALRHFGYAGAIDLLPDPQNPDLLARVRLGERRAATPAEDRLFAAIRARRTNRQPYDDRPVPPLLLAELGTAAAAEGA